MTGGAREQAKAAADVLDIGEQDGTADEPAGEQGDSERVPVGDEEAATGGGDAKPSGFDRLFRTDRALDLNETVKFWVPRGAGGINRIGAALKQMGGWEFVAPAVWLFIGALEVMYVAADDHGLIPSRSGGADRDDRADDQEPTETPPGRETATGGGPT